MQYGVVITYKTSARHCNRHRDSHSAGIEHIPPVGFRKARNVADELAQRVIANELRFQADDHGHWIYRRLKKEESGRNQVQEILETKDGLSVDFSPLTAVLLMPNSSRRRISACRGS